MLVRYDPFRELDRVSEQVFGTGARRSSMMPMDAVRRGHTVELRFDLPGVSPENLEVTVERNVLTVRAERSWAPQDGEEVLANERPQGAVARQVLLGETLDTDRLDAQCHDGVLVITIPVADQAKPRKIEVHAGGRDALDVAATR